MDPILTIISETATNYPIIGTVLAGIGAARIIGKPVSIALHKVADKYQWGWLQRPLEYVDKSPVLKGLFGFVNYVGSIELPKPKHPDPDNMKEFLGLEKEKLQLGLVYEKEPDYMERTNTFKRKIYSEKLKKD